MHNMIILLLSAPFIAALLLGLFSTTNRYIIFVFGVLGIIVSFLASLIVGIEFFLYFEEQVGIIK